MYQSIISRSDYRKQRLCEKNGPAAGPDEIPDEVLRLLREYMQLKHVPFHYIIPAKEYLPKECIRFFYIDEQWTEQYLRGICSVGYSDDQELSEGIFKAVTERLGIKTRTGFLLNSDLVRKQSGIEIKPYHIKDGIKTGLGMDRLEKINENMMLGICNGVISMLEIDEAMESIHFGLEFNADTGYHKGLRSLKDGKSMNQWIDVPLKNRDKRILDIKAVKHNMEDKLSQAAGKAVAVTAAEYALEMLQSPRGGCIYGNTGNTGDTGNTAGSRSH